MNRKPVRDKIHLEYERAGECEVLTALRVVQDIATTRVELLELCDVVDLAVNYDPKVLLCVVLPCEQRTEVRSDLT